MSTNKERAAIRATGSGASARASLRRGDSWRQATDAVLESLELDSPVDLALVFVHSRFADDYGRVLATIRERTGATHLVGCSGEGVIGTAVEAEGVPAISVMALRLPGARFTPVRVAPDRPFDAALEPVAAAEAAAWLLFADPHSIDSAELASAVDARASGASILGGLASAHNEASGTAVFLGDQAYQAGAVLMGFAGDVEVHTLVAQGAEPIGQPWTITDCEENVIRTIGSQPALEVLTETLEGLDEPTQERVRQNLLVGLAMDEYRDEYGRGDYLIRNLMGFDRASAAIAIDAVPQRGQTIQFQLRDARAADDDLASRLRAFSAQLGTDQALLGALLCACNGRGRGLFGIPHHDAQALAEELDAVPTAGLFCSGEIGPVGGQTFIHGFTATVAFITTPSG